MKYDFDKITDRSGTGAVKWEEAGGCLPFWVADMDLQTAPEIIDEITKRAEHGIYGYTMPEDSWYEAYMSWWKERHGLQIQREWLIFSTGVIPTISSVVRKITTPGENVVIQTPVYNNFRNCIENNGRVLVENRLINDPSTGYRMDMEDLERKLADPQTSLFILCNPQNPSGNIWTENELADIGQLGARYGVSVLSDEIHCDITAPGKSYVPFARVSDTCRKISITAVSPTKTFNLAGLQTSAVIVPDPFLRHKVWRGINTDEVGEGNCFAYLAAVAAFTQGGEWLDCLREYIWGNKKFIADYINGNIPPLKADVSDATYLMWIDCRDIKVPEDTELAELIRREAGIDVNDGHIYMGDGKGYIRFNAAAPRSLIEEGLARLKKGIENIR